MSDTRQKVRRDDDLPAMARLLFAEIYQMNEAGGECYAGDERLGKQLGAAESTVRRHRLTLRQKGYIKQYKSRGRRCLEPSETINNDQSDQKQSENISNADQSDQNRSKEVINSDQHRGSNNPEGVSECAREDASRDGEPQGVEVWTEVTGERPNIATREDLKTAFTGPDAPPWDREVFRDALEEAYLNVNQEAHRIRIGYLLTSYRQKLNRKQSQGDGAPSGTQFDPSKDQIRFGA